MKKVKILTITLSILTIALVAFFGVYVPIQNRMENKVKNYSYAMDLYGSRNIRLTVDTSEKTTIKDSEGNEVDDADDLTDEEIEQNGYVKETTPYNAQDVLNAENYEASKKIIEKRLSKLEAKDYQVSVDKQTGDILLQISENDNTDEIISGINTVGKFNIIDTNTKEVLMDNSDIKAAKVMYSSGSSTSTSSGTTVYLDIEFTKEGAKKLEDITGKYTENDSEDTNSTQEDSSTNTTDASSDEENTENSENTESSDTQEETDTENDTSSSDTSDSDENTITMLIDDEEIMSTSFDDVIKTGKLQLSVGSASTDTETLQGYVDQATNMATILDSGNMPVKYTVSDNQYILSDITHQDLYFAVCVCAAVVAVAGIILMIKYKTNGIVALISYLGYSAIFVLLIRYTNVVLSIQGIVAMLITLILNYIFVTKLLSKLNKNNENDKPVIGTVYKDFAFKIVPIGIMAIAFSFAKQSCISSFGMIMFWGIVLMLIYNVLITNNLFKIKASK